jgi:hypothetical protein
MPIPYSLIAYDFGDVLCVSKALGMLGDARPATWNASARFYLEKIRGLPESNLFTVGSDGMDFWQRDEF